MMDFTWLKRAYRRSIYVINLTLQHLITAGRYLKRLPGRIWPGVWAILFFLASWALVWLIVEAVFGWPSGILHSDEEATDETVSIEVLAASNGQNQPAETTTPRPQCVSDGQCRGIYVPNGPNAEGRCVQGQCEYHVLTQAEDDQPVDGWDYEPIWASRSPPPTSRSSGGKERKKTHLPLRLYLKLEYIRRS